MQQLITELYGGRRETLQFDLSEEFEYQLDAVHQGVPLAMLLTDVGNWYQQPDYMLQVLPLLADGIRCIERDDVIYTEDMADWRRRVQPCTAEQRLLLHQRLCNFLLHPDQAPYVCSILHDPVYAYLAMREVCVPSKRWYAW